MFMFRIQVTRNILQVFDDDRGDPDTDMSWCQRSSAETLIERHCKFPVVFWILLV